MILDFGWDDIFKIDSVYFDVITALTKHINFHPAA